ncbi:hypothetical protein AVEN_198730-1, partial [Araneus ventricosus]
TWAFPFVPPKIQPCRNLILLLWRNRHANPLCYGLPPHNLLPYDTPSQQHQQVWLRSVANNSTSRRKIHNLLHFLQRETSLFRPDNN